MPTRTKLIILIEGVQNVFSGLALAFFAVYKALGFFKADLGVAYTYFNMGITMFMLLMFGLSGWQTVRILRKSPMLLGKLSDIKKLEEDEPKED